MTLNPGARLGHYEVISAVGAGGMGEVYKARDVRLDRLVAIKTMRADLALSLDARLRFEREAQTISRLSHPNICTLHDVGHADGTEYLVMEWLDGETLAARIAAGPLPMAKVLAIGAEVADALAVAHRHGVVHRDLKPANVMITASGVKLLDFGIARAIEPADVDGPLDAATRTGAAPLTAKGTWLGTAPYMAPEQIQGRPVDGRSDVFALGAVLYEMATGRRAFAGSTPTEIASAILHDDPAERLSAAGEVPPAFDRLVRECLAKDPDHRWQSAHDVSLQLASIGEHTQRPTTAASGQGTRPAWTGWIGWAVAVAAVLAASSVWWRLGHAGPPALELVELQVTAPARSEFYYSVEAVPFALSPDGARLAFVARDAVGARRLWIRSLTSIAATPVPGTESAGSVFWAPDGQSIGFFADGVLKRLDLATGVAVPLGNVLKSTGFTGTWSPAGQILYAPVGGQAIYEIAGGRAATIVVKPDLSQGEARVGFPSFLPDGHRFLYLLRMADGSGWLMLGEPGQPSRRLMPAESNVAYVASGDLVFARGGTLVGQPFDLASATVKGETFAIAESVRFFVTTAVANFAASPEGTIVYQSERNLARLAWLDRTGRELRAAGTPADYLDMRIAPSGRMALLSRALPATGAYDVWALDLERDTNTRLTLDDAGTEVSPVMLPDGQTLILGAPTAGPPRLVRWSLGTGRHEILLPGASFQNPEDVSPDGRVLAYSERGAGGAFDLWTMRLSGPPEPAALRASPFEEGGLRFSPDGRHYTFLSSQSRRPEVYVAATSGGQATAVSSTGARAAVWTRDGREILYLSADRRLVSVPVVRSTPVLELGKPVTLFALGGKPWLSFDISLDGTRVLALIPSLAADEQPLTALLHWGATPRR